MGNMSAQNGKPKYPDRFRYRDMICRLVEISQSGTGNVAIKIILPEDERSIERYIKECERIPSDFLFQEIIAMIYKFTITSVKPILDINEVTGRITLLMQCRYIYGKSYSSMLGDQYGLFAENALLPDNVVFYHSYPFTIPDIRHEDSDIVDGQYLITNRVTRPFRPTFPSASPYLMEMTVSCINFAEVSQAIPHYSTRRHHALLRRINKEMATSIQKLTYEVLNHPEGLGYDIHAIVLDEMDFPTNFTLYLLCIPREMNGYEIATISYSNMLIRPVSQPEEVFNPAKRPIPNIEDAEYYFAPIIADITSQSDTLYLPNVGNINVVRNDGEAYWVLNFLPNFIPFAPNDGMQSYASEPVETFFNRHPPYYLLGEWQDGVQLTFPMFERKQPSGVICYGRLDKHQTNLDTVVDSYTSPHMIGLRVISTTASYVFFALVDTEYHAKCVCNISKSHDCRDSGLTELLVASSPNTEEVIANILTHIVFAQNYPVFNDLCRAKRTQFQGLGEALDQFGYVLVDKSYSERFATKMLQLIDTQLNTLDMNTGPSATLPVDHRERIVMEGSDEEDESEHEDDDDTLVMEKEKPYVKPEPMEPSPERNVDTVVPVHRKSRIRAFFDNLFGTD